MLMLIQPELFQVGPINKYSYPRSFQHRFLSTLILLSYIVSNIVFGFADMSFLL